MESASFWFAAIAASVMVGMGKGGLPMVGMLGVPVLSMVISPVAAAGLLLPVYVVSDIFGLYAYRREYDSRVLSIVVPGMLVGICLAWATANMIPPRAVTGLVGLIGIVFALNAIIRQKVSLSPQTARVGSGIFWGTVTGFVSFVVHSGAPPYQVYTLPLRMPKAVFAGTATIAFAICNSVKLIPYYFLGQLNFANIKLAAVLAVPASLAVFAGVWLVRVIPENTFYRIATVALFAVSVKLLWNAVLST